MEGVYMSFWKKLFGSKSEVSTGIDNQANIAKSLSAEDYERVNRLDENGWTALMSAVMDLERDDVAHLLGRGADVNLQDTTGKTALMHAGRFSIGDGYDQLAIVTMLLEHGADLNLQDQMGRTALMHAASRNAYIIVETLLGRGADANLQDREGRTALMSAATCTDEFAGAAVALLQQGADVNLQNQTGGTALMSAAIFGNNEIVAALHDLGAIIDTQDKNGRTALMFAAEKGHADVIATLLERDADANLQDKSGRTALAYATAGGHSEAMAILNGDIGADLGAQVDDTDDPVYQSSYASRAGPDDGWAAMFVFDYERMGSAYGQEVFGAIAECLKGSSGTCAFLHGDLEEAAGGPSRVPALLTEIRDNGWNITSHRGDSPLVLLAIEEAIYAYAAVLWTDHSDNVSRLHDHLSRVLPEAYLGSLDYPKTLGIEKFHEVFRPLNLPVWGTFSYGESQQS
jgi:ankyrin repeat protein